VLYLIECKTHLQTVKHGIVMSQGDL